MSAHTDIFIAFIGGGNMATAIIGGLIRQGHPIAGLHVIEPCAAQRERLIERFPGIEVQPCGGSMLPASDLVIWAIKPQIFKDVVAQTQLFLPDTAHLSVAAGIPCQSLAAWLGSERVVRAMPNTPALVGMGMTGLFAHHSVSQAQRNLVDHTLQTIGDCVWVDTEQQLDAVTALSGSGPAYVFYFLEAMREAGSQMGLPAALAQRLAIGTFLGAATLAQRSSEPLETLRQGVTSKGGTTHAALSAMQQADIKARFEEAMFAAYQRAQAMGLEFGQ